jgi:hypothetical protein
MGLNPGVGYTGSNLGGAYGLSIDQSIDWLTRNIGRQFECSLSGKKVGEQSEYYLQVRKGLVEFDYYGTDDKGIIDIDNLGGFNGTNTQNMFFYMNKFNVFESGKRVTGENNETSDFISDGYIKLDKEKNYFVFIYKTTPDWQQEGNLYEARAPQIGVAADDSEANIFIKTQRNGGGFLQSYLKLSGGGTVENVVTADPLSGKIAEFDAAELNDYINFDTDLLDIVRSQGQGANHAERYPAGMQAWIGEGFVPVFAKPSTDYNEDKTVNGMTADGVPTAMTTSIDVSPSVENSFYAPTWWVTDTPNAPNVYQSNVIVGWDVGTLYGYTANPIVSGLLNYNDLTIVPHADAPASDIIYFDNTDIAITATSQTSITTVGAMTDEGTGFVVTDCYRQDIAYIKWEATLNRFQIYQLQYGPIKLRQNPLGSFKNKLLTEEEIAEWDEGFDLCEFITGSFSGYTKDLNQSTIGTQPPVYAGSENIGNYQSPKETL